MKKKICLGIAAFVTIYLMTMLCCDYVKKYSVLPDNSNLEEYIVDSISIESIVPDVKVYETIDVGDKKFALAEVGNTGVGTDTISLYMLRRGITGKYGFDSGTFGFNSIGNFQELVVAVKDKTYFLLGGRNTNCDIGKIIVELEGKEYEMEIPKQNMFLVSCEIDTDGKVVSTDLDKIQFYSRDGENITEQVAWN